MNTSRRRLLATVAMTTAATQSVIGAYLGSVLGGSAYPAVPAPPALRAACRPSGSGAG
jgi:hypothetical protein